MVDEFNDLTVMHDYAWTLILRGTVDHKSPARHPTFGTIGLQGMPELRTVVLRQADQKSASLEVHTDLKSAKVKELKSNPNVGIHIWFPKLKLQIRIKAISEIETGETVKEKNGIKFQKDPEFLMEQSQSLGHLYQPHLFMKNQPILIDFVLFF